MPTTRQWEIQNSMFRTLVDCFFSRDFLRAQNSGRFELSRLRVTEGQIAVNV